MNLQAIQLSDVLSYEEKVNYKGYIVKCGSVELHPAQAQWLNEHKQYLIAYRSVYYIDYSQNLGGFYGRKMYQAPQSVLNYTKRGRFSYASAKEVNRWLGFKLLVEDIY